MSTVSLAQVRIAELFDFIFPLSISRHKRGGGDEWTISLVLGQSTGQTLKTSSDHAGH